MCWQAALRRCTNETMLIAVGLACLTSSQRAPSRQNHPRALRSLSAHTNRAQNTRASTLPDSAAQNPSRLHTPRPSMLRVTQQAGSGAAVTSLEGSDASYRRPSGNRPLLHRQLALSPLNPLLLPGLPLCLLTDPTVRQLITRLGGVQSCLL